MIPATRKSKTADLAAAADARRGCYCRAVKPLIDVAAAALLLVLLAPLLLVIATLLALGQRGRVLFVQTRPGLQGRPFRLIKFKTMNDDVDSQGNLLPDEARLTRIGRLLRRTSLDELPQLVNVLCGQMSLVGPRPLLMRYLDRYSPEQARRHEVRPGITGWAQVLGRNALSWEEKFALDVWYVDHCSCRLDFKILFLTVLKVVRREGAVPSKEFLGTAHRGSKERLPV